MWTRRRARTIIRGIGRLSGGIILLWFMAACAVVPRSEQVRAESPQAPTATPGSRISIPLSVQGLGPTRSPRLPTPTIAPTTAVEVSQYSYRVVHTYPHDRNAFTQGLVWEDGVLFEGTGLNGQSTIRKVDLASGTVLQSQSIAAEYFGEGITIFGDQLYQLTWQSNTGFVYDKDSFQAQGDWSYPTEGWGLTHDSKSLIMSDGTATLRFLDPETLTVTHQIDVTDRNVPVASLNELEYVEGEIFANIWQTDRIARIDPASGQVVGWIDLSGLLTAEDREQPVDVLNGIAYHAAEQRLFVTGKWWPKLFEIELVPAQ